MTWLSIADKLLIERGELLLIAAYLVFFWKDRQRQPVTMCFLVIGAALVGVDVWYFHGVRSDDVWKVLNICAIIVPCAFLYEKILKKSVVCVFRKCVVLVLMLFD
jgi:hypothetical protein